MFIMSTVWLHQIVLWNSNRIIQFFFFGCLKLLRRKRKIHTTIYSRPLSIFVLCVITFDFVRFEYASRSYKINMNPEMYKNNYFICQAIHFKMPMLFPVFCYVFGHRLNCLSLKCWQIQTAVNWQIIHFSTAMHVYSLAHSFLCLVGWVRLFFSFSWFFRRFCFHPSLSLSTYTTK